MCAQLVKEKDTTNRKIDRSYYNAAGQLSTDCEIALYFYI